MAVLRKLKYLQRSTLDILYKTTGRSVIYYGLVVYSDDLKQKHMKRVSRVQYNAATLVSRTLPYTRDQRSPDDLLNDLFILVPR